ncbi:MAG: hypothetical protein KJ970_19460 [Candidatus Eisenbacteria bacterium]|uniref:Uncharacterized protein n=1 Tax=Eiseniibacteriota bacterium TaxID=2212470 RepID=A0A948W8A2_UNCEI|nr:hypothetical protein [Candidatus Eisenbacteria bacterium]MBU1948308.1 hypothetical protein [Candidatus Eisenbacteria bacterium]MBU2693100.1 hypothetical protein [Candidatus Eisenbacteria bacterium]
MKNQYFGDINDYRKYGLLRVLARATGLSAVICWMLTPDDGGTDGRFTTYLCDKETWRRYDPPLFDALHEAVVRRRDRSTRHVERSGILPGFEFFNEIVPQDAPSRKAYFDELGAMAQDTEWIFFDPDNGMEVASVPDGRAGSPKYLYWHEVRKVFNNNVSLLVYQHFPRRPREEFIKSTARWFIQETKAVEVISFATSRIVFFLIPQKRHRLKFRRAALAAGRQWDGQIAVAYHSG